MNHTPTPEEIAEFKKQIDENRYDFCKLVYLIFPFGEPGHELEHMEPYDWQMEEWRKLSNHLKNPLTRYQTYRLIISSGNGAAKTAFGAMTYFMLMYTQQVRGRITTNTMPQMNTVVWPEYDIWYRRARYSNHFFEKQGTSIKARNPELAESWRLDTITWSEQTPASISGLHNKGKCVLYIFEEAPGIPAIIWQYASGAFTETETIKVWMAFGNSDDPESKFEQNMASPDWHALRIDTRTLKHIDPEQIGVWLRDAGGDEDHDDFRVRVRGLPRKTAKDSIIKKEWVEAAFARAKTFDRESVSFLPVIVTCDPAWKGGDETTVWIRQGHYMKLVEKYKLTDDPSMTHLTTYNRISHHEAENGGDAVNVDQAEGTGIYSFAQMYGKHHWQLINFASSPNDKPDPKQSEYGNIRAQMYYQLKDFLLKGGILDVEDPAWKQTVIDQLSWAKGTQHKTTLKKMVEPKEDIIERVGHSPDVADGAALGFAREVNERLPENDRNADPRDRSTGAGAWKMPEHENPYGNMEEDLERLYD
jgi:hypothetical protein